MYNNGYYNNSKLEKIILQLIQEAKLASFLFISLIGYHYIARRVPHKKFAILSQNSHHKNNSLPNYIYAREGITKSLILECFYFDKR